MVSGSNRLPVTAPQCAVSPHEKISSRNRREEIFLFAHMSCRSIYNRAVLWYTTLRTAYCAVFAASGGRGNVGAKPRESVTVKPPKGGSVRIPEGCRHFCRNRKLHG